jgi:hypothetical protein
MFWKPYTTERSLNAGVGREGPTGSDCSQESRLPGQIQWYCTCTALPHSLIVVRTNVAFVLPTIIDLASLFIH